MTGEAIEKMILEDLLQLGTVDFPFAARLIFARTIAEDSLECYLSGGESNPIRTKRSK